MKEICTLSERLNNSPYSYVCVSRLDDKIDLQVNHESVDMTVEQAKKVIKALEDALKG